MNQNKPRGQMRSILRTSSVSAKDQCSKLPARRATWGHQTVFYYNSPSINPVTGPIPGMTKSESQQQEMLFDLGEVFGRDSEMDFVTVRRRKRSVYSIEVEENEEAFDSLYCSRARNGSDGNLSTADYIDNIHEPELEYRMTLDPIDECNDQQILESSLKTTQAEYIICLNHHQNLATEILTKIKTIFFNITQQIPFKIRKFFELSSLNNVSFCSRSMYPIKHISTWPKRDEIFCHPNSLQTRTSSWFIVKLKTLLQDMKAHLALLVDWLFRLLRYSPDHPSPKLSRICKSRCMQLETISQATTHSSAEFVPTYFVAPRQVRRQLQK
jgi:hypothetical protein